MSYPVISPALVGPAMLAVLKGGKPVERITVWFTHAQLHQLFDGENEYSQKIRRLHPLEIVLAEGMDMEKRIDCRFHQAPWHIDIRTAKEKKAARIPYEAPDPTPPAPDPETPPNLVRAVVELLEPYEALAEWEYRLSVAALQKKRLMEKLVPQAQAPTEDTAHAQ